MVEIILWILAFIVGALSTGRVTRLVVHDTFPPSVKFRMWWDDKTDGSLWNPLFNCHFCFSFWVAAVVGTSAWLTNLHPAWWIINGIFAMSYLAAIIVDRDQKD